MTAHLVEGFIHEFLLVVIISTWGNVFSKHAFASRADFLDLQVQVKQKPSTIAGRYSWSSYCVDETYRLRLRGGVSTRSDPFIPYENQQNDKNPISPAYGSNERKRTAAASAFGTDARKRTAKRLLISTDDDGMELPGSNEESAHTEKEHAKRDADEDLIVPDQCESLKEALRLAVPGQTIYVRAGEHRWRAELAAPTNTSTDIRGELGARLWGQWARRALQVRIIMRKSEIIIEIRAAMPESNWPIESCYANRKGEQDSMHEMQR
jgi:hypothetical protein